MAASVTAECARCGHEATRMDLHHVREDTRRVWVCSLCLHPGDTDERPTPAPDPPPVRRWARRAARLRERAARLQSRADAAEARGQAIASRRARRTIRGHRGAPPSAQADVPLRRRVRGRLASWLYALAQRVGGMYVRRDRGE